MAITVERLKAILELDDKKLKSGLDEAKTVLQDFRAKVAAMSKPKLDADISSLRDTLSIALMEIEAFESKVGKKKPKITPEVDTSKAEKDFDRWRGKMTRAGFELQRTGHLLTAGVTAPIAGLGALLVQTGNEFDQATKIMRVQSGATGKELKSLQATLKDLLKDVPQDIAPTARALAELSDRTGLVGKPLKALAEQILHMAQLNDEDLFKSVINTTRLFASWQIQTEDNTRALDHLFKLQQLTGMQMTRLADRATFFAAPMKALGFSFEEATALIAKFEQEGVNFDTVLRSMRLALGRFAKEGVRDPMQAIDILFDRIKNARTTGEAATIALSVFGQRAGADVAQAVREGRLEISSLLNTVRGGTDTITGAARENRTLTDSWKLLSNELKIEVLPVASDLVKSLKDMVPAIRDVIKVAGDLAKRFSELPEGVQTWVIGLTLAAAAVGPLVLAIGALVGAIPGIAVAFKFVIAAFRNPWVLAIMAVVGTIFLLHKAWVNNTFSIRTTTLQFAAWMAPFWKSLWKRLSDTVVGGVMFIVKAVSAGFNAVAGVVVTISDFVTGKWRNMWDNIKTIAAQGERDIGEASAYGDQFIKGLGETFRDPSKEMEDNLTKEIARQQAEALKKAPKAPAVVDAGKEMWRQLGVNLRQGLNVSRQETEAALDAIYEKFGKARTRKAPMSELEKQTRAYNREVAQTQARVKTLNNILAGNDSVTTSVASKYRLLGAEQHRHLSRLQLEENSLKNQVNVRKQFNKELADTQAKIKTLKEEGKAEITPQQRFGAVIPAAEVARLTAAKRQLNELERQRKENERRSKEETRVTEDITSLTNDLAVEHAKLTATLDIESFSLDKLNRGFSSLTLSQQENLKTAFAQFQVNKALKDQKEEDERITSILAAAENDEIARKAKLTASTSVETFALDKLNRKYSELSPAQQEFVDRVFEQVRANNSLQSTNEEHERRMTTIGNLTNDLMGQKARLTASTDLETFSLDKLNVAYKDLSPQEQASLKTAFEQYQANLRLKESIDAKNAAEKRSTDITRKIAEQQAVANQKLRELTGQSAKHSRIVAILGEQYGQLTIEQQAALQKLFQTENLIAKVEAWRDMLKLIAQETKRIFTNAFEALFTEGFGGFFNKVLTGFEDMLAKMAAQWLSSQLFKLLVSGLAGIFGGNTAGWLSALEGRQHGGPVRKGEPYIVGEQRPELFVPSQSGRVEPAVGGSPVNITIVTPDVHNFKMTQSQWSADVSRAVEQGKRRARAA